MDKRKVTIYKITNPKNKCYVGSTLNYKDRLYRYKTLRVKKQLKIYRSLCKYGVDSHTFEVLFICDECCRNVYENYYGFLYNCISENGLNLVLPKIQDKVSCTSKETREKISINSKGKIISNKQKEQTSKRSKEWHKKNKHPMKGKEPWNKGIEFMKGENNPMYGLKFTKEHKKNISKGLKEKYNNGFISAASKLVLDTNTGIYYDSLRKAALNQTKYSYSYLKSLLNKKNTVKTSLIYVHQKQ
tara:strand:+ start:350 stop:1081 length:732 start_codon:yes stop_codon:yes gene_type:complete